MVRFKIFRLATGLALVIVPAALTHAQTTTQYESIQVTATRVPEDVISTPASVTVISGEELAARGVDDLAGAPVAGRGRQRRPRRRRRAGRLGPRVLGLREFDAFLLVVDGVPWGGAFNPALPSLDLTDVERIEVLRGSAPVMYGATSFVGVIQVIHRAAGRHRPARRLSAAQPRRSGRRGGGAARRARQRGRQSLTVDGERRGLRRRPRRLRPRPPALPRHRRQRRRGPALRRRRRPWLARTPPVRIRARAAALSPRVPLDANHQPKDAHLDEDRFTSSPASTSETRRRPWTSTRRVTHTRRDLTRGFLGELDDAADPNAAGFRQDQTQTDVYFDTHLCLAARRRPCRSSPASTSSTARGRPRATTFDYHVNARRLAAPRTPTTSRCRKSAARGRAQLRRPLPARRVDAGPALALGGRRAPQPDPRGPGGARSSAEQRATKRPPQRRQHHGERRLGVSLHGLGRRRGDSVWVYADYRNTFKPAADRLRCPRPRAGHPQARDRDKASRPASGAHGGGRYRWQASDSVSTSTTWSCRR